MYLVENKDDTNSIIDSIENLRKENNVNWMDLVRLAIGLAPNEAKEILGKIVNKDEEITKLVGALQPACPSHDDRRSGGAASKK